MSFTAIFTILPNGQVFRALLYCASPKRSVTMVFQNLNMIFPVMYMAVPFTHRRKTNKKIGLMGEFLHDEEVSLLAEKLIHANRVKIFGLNRTGHSAQQLRQRFHKINFDAEAVTDYVLIPEIANQGRPGDLHLYFSTQGETPIIFEAIKASCQQKVYTVLVTMNDNTKMKKYADLLIQLPTTKAFSSDYFFDLQPINMIFIEILISCMGEKLTSK